MSYDQLGVDKQQVIQDVQPTVQSSRQEKEEQTAAQDFQHVKTSGQPSMQVKVSSPFTDYFDGQAFSISAVNATGPFDILPRHHNFISLLDPCELVIRRPNQEYHRIRISGGIMHVKADKVTVFLDV